MTAAATQLIPTLAKVTRRVCISGDGRISEVNTTVLKQSASSKFSQDKQLYNRLFEHLKQVVENITIAEIMESFII